MKPYGVTIQMKATEQYFPVVLFIMLYKVVLTSESADEIAWCEDELKPLQQYFRMVTYEIWDLLTIPHGTGCFNDDVCP